jgi:penicillin-binding protein 1C
MTMYGRRMPSFSAYGPPPIKPEGLRPKIRPTRPSYFLRTTFAAFLLACLTYATAILRHANFDAPTPTAYITDTHGAFLAQVGHTEGKRTEYGYWLAAPPPDRVVRATLALEDRHFWNHPGVDAGAVLRAAWQDFSRTGHSGASTIAMQVARMQNPRPRTLWAKVVEAGTAIALTLRYSRNAVLAQYLRLVPYGNGSHGIAHAARFYFDKPASDLSWAEIALLAAIPQAPARMASSPRPRPLSPTRNFPPSPCRRRRAAPTRSPPSCAWRAPSATERRPKKIPPIRSCARRSIWICRRA